MPAQRHPTTNPSAALHIPSAMILSSLAEMAKLLNAGINETISRPKTGMLVTRTAQRTIFATRPVFISCGGGALDRCFDICAH
jgi:hypothetical protein